MVIRRTAGACRRVLGRVRRKVLSYISKPSRSVPTGSSAAPVHQPASGYQQLRDRFYEESQLGDSDLVVFTLFGLGDTFLVLSLLDEVRRRHIPGRIVVYIKQTQAAVADLFDFDNAIEVKTIDSAEAGRVISTFARHREENLVAPGRACCLHPSLFTGYTLDNIYHIEQFSQLDMYKQLLHLPLATRPDFYTKASWPHPSKKLSDGAPRVLLCPFANSFPPPPASFWERLANRLLAEGCEVAINAFDASGSKEFPRIDGTQRLEISLPELLQSCGSYDWVIGPLTGLLNVLTSAGSPNYKTFVIWDNESGVFEFNPSTHRASAFPYAYQTKYDGLLHNCDHVVASASREREACDRVLSGLELLRAAGSPVQRAVPFYAPTHPGDILDRLSIARVKSNRLDGVRKLVAEREVEYFGQVVDEMLRLATCREDLLNCLEELVDLNDRAWESNEQIYQTFEKTGWADSLSSDRDWDEIRAAFSNMAQAQSLNRQRVAIKNRSTTLLGNTFLEVKSFDDPWKAGDSPRSDEHSRAA